MSGDPAVRARTTCRALWALSLHPPGWPSPRNALPSEPVQHGGGGLSSAHSPLAPGRHHGAVSPTGLEAPPRVRREAQRPSAPALAVSVATGHTRRPQCRADAKSPEGIHGHDPPPHTHEDDDRHKAESRRRHGRGETGALAHGQWECKRVSSPRRTAQQLLEDLVPADPDVRPGGNPSPHKNVSTNVPGSPPRGSRAPKPPESIR